jgi:hypothetical protein
VIGEYRLSGAFCACASISAFGCVKRGVGRGVWGRGVWGEGCGERDVGEGSGERVVGRGVWGMGCGERGVCGEV